tara:strand:+ start:3057 stop:3863 length:807 start_codon:yes stop_codon:yes gene_type:complete
MVRKNFLFDKSYHQYWKSTVKKSIDGTIIAGSNQVDYFLKKIKIIKNHKILDLGCSNGRMFGCLSNYSNFIYGSDIDQFAINEAKKKKYVKVKKSSAENITFPKSFFDIVFCWAVFDVVDQGRSLKSIYKVLKKDGLVIITGKNDNYLANDKLAFQAEKNAYQKKFPNKFTKLYNLINFSNSIGFEKVNLLLFKKRGDIGNLKYFRVKKINKNIQCYEFLLILKKTEIKKKLKLQNIILSSNISQTANQLSKKYKFKNTKEFFKNEKS